MTKYKVTIIIINYNSAVYTNACINSIIKFTNNELKYNIVVVDNNSNADDYEKLVNYCCNNDKVKIVRSKINLGFAGGNMFGVQFTDSEYIFFLNNDTELLNDCVTILYNFMKGKKIGVCTGQMYNSDLTFHFSFGYFPTLGTKLLGNSILRLFNPKQYPKQNMEYTEPLQVSFVTGAAMFVDYSIFSELSGFDTNYFLYCEEEDFGMKLKLNAYPAYLVPDAKFIHHSGKSTGRNFEIEKENYISVLYFQRKYSSLIVYDLLKIYYFIKTIKKFYKNVEYIKLAFFILRGADLKNSLKHKQKLRIEKDCISSK